MRRGEGEERGKSGSARRPQQLAVPDHLPGETEYGTFINHMTGCADCGYGQVQCAKATELWQAYKTARRGHKRT